jgi:hypothetical protein
MRRLFMMLSAGSLMLVLVLALPFLGCKSNTPTVAAPTATPTPGSPYTGISQTNVTSMTIIGTPNPGDWIPTSEFLAASVYPNPSTPGTIDVGVNLSATMNVRVQVYENPSTKMSDETFSAIPAGITGLTIQTRDSYGNPLKTNYIYRCVVIGTTTQISGNFIICNSGGPCNY